MKDGRDLGRGGDITMRERERKTAAGSEGCLRPKTNTKKNRENNEKVRVLNILKIMKK